MFEPLFQLLGNAHAMLLLGGTLSLAALVCETATGLPHFFKK